MSGGVGQVVDGVGQQVVEEIGAAADEDAQRRTDGHRQQHVDRRFLRLQLRIVSEEGKVGDLDAGVLEYSSRSKQQQEPQPAVPFLHGSSHHHRLADETAKQRHRRDRCRADQAQHRGDRHLLPQAAEVGASGRAGDMQHRPHRHEQQSLEQHVVEGVRDRTIDRQFGTDPDADHHETDLVDHAVREHLAQIIFDDGVEDGKDGHRRTDEDQFLGTGEEARQRVDRRLGGERRQEHGAGGAGCRIGIDDPGMEQRETRLDTEGEQDPRHAW